MKKFFLFIAVTVALSTTGFAQVTTVPVDPLTGRLALTLPVTELHSGSISVPVVLVYTAGSGVQASAEEGSAGVGWDIAVSGAVRRELRSLPDDYKGTGSDQRMGWLNGTTTASIQSFVPASDDDLSACEDERNDFNFVNSLNYNIDPEPDLFSFSAPGLSGQFMFDADGVPQPIPYQDIKITPTKDGNGKITKFDIITNTGVTYSFTILETSSRQTTAAGSTVNYLAGSYGYYQQLLNYTSAWNLSKISAPDGSKVDYVYYTTPSEKVRQPVAAVVTETGTVSDQYTTVNVTNRMELWYLQTNLNVLSFTWTNHRISKVELADNSGSSLSIRYTFTYKNYKDKWSTAGGNTRGFLTTVNQESNCIAYPAYTFSYNGVDDTDNSVTLPFSTNGRTDLWGYSNGTSASSIPALYVNPAGADGERMRVIPIASEAPTLSGDSRAVDASYVASGMPSLIQYPTGSNTYIQYEPNSYFDAAANKTQLGGGVRVKSVHFGPTKTEYYYTSTGNAIATDPSSGKISYPPSYAFADGTATLRTTFHLGPESYVLYSRAVVRQSGRGKTVYDYLVPAMYPLNTEPLNTENDWNATKSRVARFVAVISNPPCTSIGNQVNGYYTFPFAPNTNFEFERGLPQFIRDYSETGAKVQERSYTYQRLTPGTITIKGVRLERLANNVVYGLYSVIANTGKVVQTETIARADELNPGPDPANPVNVLATTTTYAYSTIHQLLESVKVINSDANPYFTYFQYAKDFDITYPDPTQPEAMGLAQLNASNRHGTLLKTYSTAPGVQSSGATITLYKDFGDGRVLPSLKASYPQGLGYEGISVVYDATSGTEKLVFSNKYLSTIQSYSAVGNVMSVKDYRQRRSGVLYDFTGELPYATVTNALAEEVAYDGFEDATPFFTVTNATRSANATWAGSYGEGVMATSKLVRDNLSKGAKRYRASCWVNAATATNITFRVYSGATTQATTVLAYSATDVNQWKYIEAIVDMSSVGAFFSLEVTSSATANIDEVRFYPTDATMTTFAYNILKGKIAEVGERGEAVFTNYDDLNRVTSVLDQNKDIRLLKEYNFASNTTSTPQVIEGDFLPADGTQFYVDDHITFTGSDNCLSVSYAWTMTLNNVTQSGIGQVVPYIPSVPGQLIVSLTVSYPTLAPVTTIHTYCIMPQPITFTVVARDLEHTVPTEYQNNNYGGDDCAANVKRFTVTNLSTSCADLTYKWTIVKHNVGGDVTQVLTTSGGPVYTNDSSLESLKVSYDMICTITALNCGCSPISASAVRPIYYHTPAEQCP